MGLWPIEVDCCRGHTFMAVGDVPDIISAAVGLSIADETGAIFVQELSTFDALEARGVPFQIRGHTQNVLVLDV
jgi:hypothetical protein